MRAPHFCKSLATQGVLCFSARVAAKPLFGGAHMMPFHGQMQSAHRNADVRTSDCTTAAMFRVSQMELRGQGCRQAPNVHEVAAAQVLIRHSVGSISYFAAAALRSAPTISAGTAIRVLLGAA